MNTRSADAFLYNHQIYYAIDMTEQQTPGGPQPQPGREVANLMAAMANTTVLVAFIIFGLLLDFIGELVSIATTPGTAGFSAAEVLLALGNFVIVVILFYGGIAKRDASDMYRFGMVLAAAIVFFATFHLF